MSIETGVTKICLLTREDSRYMIERI